MEEGNGKVVALTAETETVDGMPSNRFRKQAMVDIEVEGQLLTASQKVLKEASPVFKAMLENEEFVEGRTQIIELPDKTEDDVVMMLTFLTPRTKWETTNIDARKMVKYADEYQIKSLMVECEAVLLAEITNANISLEYVYLAQKYNLEKLLNATIDECICVSPDRLIERSCASFEKFHPNVISEELDENWTSGGEWKYQLVGKIVKYEHFFKIIKRRDFELRQLCQSAVSALPMCRHSTLKCSQSYCDNPNQRYSEYRFDSYRNKMKHLITE